MPSIMSHAVVASSLGAAGAPDRPMPLRYWVALAVLAAAPDADVIAFWLNVDRAHILSHRGLTHSLPFAALAAALAVRMLFRGREWHASWPRLWAIYFAAIASHGLLDAFTNGGQGIAYFAPFSASRWHASWQPILVSPIGVGAFFSQYGFRVLLNEMLWLWLPSLLLAAAARLVRRRRSSRTKAIAA
jgi:inner membrane protein